MAATQMIYGENIPFHIAIDFIIFGYYEGELQILLTKGKKHQDRELWSLISGFLAQNEDLEQAASRIFKQLTGMPSVHLEQLYTYSNPASDPATHVITVAYYAIIKLVDQNEELANEYSVKWFNIKEIRKFVFDPGNIVNMALLELQEHAKVIPVGITLMPVNFTITQLQTMYEAIFQKKLDRGNFRKSILSLDLLEKLEEKDKSGSRKGAWLYRFNEQKFNDLNNNGALFKISF